jgi:hypothetical protein
MKIYLAVQKLLLGDTQTDRQTGDLISLLSFLESRLKRGHNLSAVDSRHLYGENSEHYSNEVNCVKFYRKIRKS